jgi:hypothetical protein
MRIVKKRLCGDAELVAALGILALVDDPAGNAHGALNALGVLAGPRGVVGLEAGNLGTIALQAAHAIRPAHRLKVVDAGFRGSELFGGVYQVYSRNLYL